MNILFSATNAFCKYLNIDPPRIPSPDGKRIGTQPIQTTQDTMAWQCHAVKRQSSAGEMIDVIVAEARSRYVILFSNPEFGNVNEFVEEFGSRWSEESVHMAMESGATTQEQCLVMLHQFDTTAMTVEIFRNTDLSVNGHVSDAEQWLVESYPNYGVDILDRSEEIGLGMHINQFRKKAKPYPGVKRQESFLPMSRMVDDWLYRFARGLSQWSYPGTKDGNFPNPYAAEVCSEQTQTRTSGEVNNTLPDNVVSLEQVRRNKKR